MRSIAGLAAVPFLVVVLFLVTAPVCAADPPLTLDGVAIDPETELEVAMPDDSTSRHSSGLITRSAAKRWENRGRRPGLRRRRRKNPS